MATKQIWEEAFIAGLRHGYTNGRAAQLTASDMKTNAEAAYRIWFEESGQHLIDSGTFGPDKPK